MTADGGGVVWSAAQKGVKGMDLGDLERAVGGGSQPEPEPGAGGGRRKAPQAVAEEKEAREKAAMIAAMKRRVEGGGAKEPAAAPLTPAQQAVSHIKAADALLAEGTACAESLQTALGLYRAALAHFGRRPKLEQKIAEVEGRLGAEGGRR